MWFTNYVIAQGITKFVPHKDYKVDPVKVKIGNKFEERKLKLSDRDFASALVILKEGLCLWNVGETHAGTLLEYYSCESKRINKPRSSNSKVGVVHRCLLDDLKNVLS